MNTIQKVVIQREHEVSNNPAISISTLLGSCVACCLWDPVNRLGGVNHMLVAHLRDSRTAKNLEGVNAMDLLIKDILQLGGEKKHLVAKVFGGASMVDGLSGIGEANIAFTLNFLAREKIKCVSRSLGGRQARHLLFWPVSGQAQQKFIYDNEKLSDVAPMRASTRAAGNGYELY